MMLAGGQMKFVAATLAVVALVVGAFAQSSLGKWEVLQSWGQLPAGTTWGAASQVATTKEGQIVVFRRMNPS